MNERLNRWWIAIPNVLSLVVAVPMTFITLFLGVIGSGGGFSLGAMIAYYGSFAIIPVAIVFIVASQIRRSLLLAIIGILVAPLPLVVGMLLA